eukprot:scaffold162906_cov46-Cyclotella_meneghiniana.AAC.1
MAEGEVKPKIERTAEQPRRQQRYRRKTNFTKEKFKAPTQGLEHMVFKQGDAADAVAFEEVKKALAKHAGTKFKVGSNMARVAIGELRAPTIVMPAAPTQADPNVQTPDEYAYSVQYTHLIDKYYKEEAAWEDARPRAFQLVLSHVDPELEEKLEASAGWAQMTQDQDVIELLRLIRSHAHKHDEMKQGTMSLVEHDLDLYLNYQKADQDLSTFHKLFKARCEVINTFGGQAGYHPTLLLKHRRRILVAECQPIPPATELLLSQLTRAQNDAAMHAACEEYKASLFIKMSNEQRYGVVKRELDNMYLFDQDAYPQTLEKAYNYLLNYQAKSSGGGRQPRGNYNNEGVAFMEAGAGGRRIGPCYNCNKYGHLARDCDELTNAEKDAVKNAGKKPGGKTGQAHINVGDDAHDVEKANEELQECLDGVANINVSLGDASIASLDDDYGFVDGIALHVSTGRDGKRVDCGRNKLFLDSCATQHTMFAPEYLSRRHTTKVYLNQHCNAGTKLTNKCGYYAGLRFYESPGGIANLLSAPALEKAGWKIDFKTGQPIQAMSPDGLLFTFKRDTGMTSGMPYIDMDRPKDHVSHVVSKDSITCVETVRKNMQGFTLEQCTRAKGARDAMAMMAHPPEDKIKHLVSANNVANMPFTSTDFANSRVMFGPDRGAIRGKTVRQRPHRVRPELIVLPQQLYERLRDVVLTADVMFVNGLPFFVTLSRDIKLGTLEFLPSRTTDQLHKSLQTVARIYRRGGFLVKMCLMDMEFKKLEDGTTEVMINTTAAREHVTDIERYIRSIKDRCRSVLSELPYKECMPDVFIIFLLKFVILWMNAFPAKNGVSDEFSPREIVTGLRLDYKKHCQARFGAYVEASYDADVTNTMNDRTAPCIVLGPTGTGNVQGSVNCFNLETKKVVTRRTIKSLPMPDRVIRRVKQLGKRCTQKRVGDRLQFLNRMKEQFSWGDGTEEYDETQGLVEPSPTDILPAEIPGVDLEDDYEQIQAVQDSPSAPSRLAVASAVLTNANLRQTASPTTEIAGVVDDGNLDPPMVSDDEDESDNDEEDDDDDGSADDPDDDDDSQPDFGNNEDSIASDQEPEDEESVEDNEEQAGQINLQQQQQADSPQSTGAVRRSVRRRKAPKRMKIDFENKAWVVEDGVLHISNGVLEAARENTKITSPILPKPKAADGRIQIKSPRTGGISRQALNKVSMGVFHLPAPSPTDDEAVVEDHVIMHILGVVLAEQYSINKGIRLFGERAKDSVRKELRQLHDYVTYTPIHAHELTPEQKKQALASLIFITEKRCGRIKARACANGSTQRDYIPKETTASPTVMNDSVMITSAVDAHEEREVVTLDIPGAFLHADLDEEVVMLLRGQLADLMVEVDPELYGPYLRKTKKGESILYVKMLKAMYGLLRSALLFYLKLVKDLTDFGFELNPYDPCVANKMVNGTQMTVVWHVDDLKVSHKSKDEIMKLVGYIKGKYGEGLTVHDGHVHDYLGVDHDYSEKGVVKMSMMKHIDKIFKDFPEDIGKSSQTPASENLFKIRDPEENDKSKKWLDPERTKDFHHSVAQLLFVSTRVRRDIQTAVAFLTTRVKKPDQDDWGKLKRVLKYLKGTKHMRLRLSVDNLGVIHWWVDASYNVHEDCKGQTGAMMSLGRGAPISFSRKQKLNVRSSCEGELVGVDDAMPYILWARYFIEAQGYTVEQNIIFQDNKSTILLATNGRWSSNKRTKHIKSRYFFVKDKVDAGEVSVEYRPTDQMWCDVLTKPKQGQAFRKDRAMLMNCDVDYCDEKSRSDIPAVLLPKPEGPVNADSVTSIISQDDTSEKDRRSVLD